MLNAALIQMLLHLDQRCLFIVIIAKLYCVLSVYIICIELSIDICYNLMKDKIRGTQ